MNCVVTTFFCNGYSVVESGTLSFGFAAAPSSAVVDTRTKMVRFMVLRSFLRLKTKGGYEIYNTGRFGRGCLLARRLVDYTNSENYLVELT